MKTTLKTIFLFFTAAVMLTACSDDDKNPPTAGFSLSDLEPVQWDVVAIASNPTAADEVVYTVSGGAYEMDGNSSIQFLEAKSYTVTQTVTNADGTDATSLTVQVEVPENKYSIAGTDLPITASPAWSPANEAHGTKALLHFIADVSGQDSPNHIKLAPILGTNPLQGTYTYNSDKETIGTYYARVIANYGGAISDPSDWTTNFGGEAGGSDLKIELVYEDSDDANNNVYDFTIDNYTLSTGYMDWTTFQFVEVEQKSFSIHYRGIVVVNAE